MNRSVLICAIAAIYFMKALLKLVVLAQNKCIFCTFVLQSDISASLALLKSTSTLSAGGGECLIKGS